MSTPVRVSGSVSESPQEDLRIFLRRLLELSTSLSTSTGNVYSLEETTIQESSMLQFEQFFTVQEAKFLELQFSRGYTLNNNKQILVVTQHHLVYHALFGYT